MIDINKTTRAPEYVKQMNAICPGYPCGSCGRTTNECGYYNKCELYQKWMESAWKQTCENVRKATHTTETEKEYKKEKQDEEYKD